MKKYNSTKLNELVQEIAVQSASSPDKVTVFHLYYAYCVLITMPINEVLEEVGGDENRNTRVRFALEMALTERCFIIDKSVKLTNTNLKAIKKLLFAYLPLIENSKNISELHKYYQIFLKSSIRWARDETSNEIYPDEAFETECFLNLLSYVSTYSGIKNYENLRANEKAENSEDDEYDEYEEDEDDDKPF